MKSLHLLLLAAISLAGRLYPTNTPLTMTFDNVAEGTPFAFDASYEESGIVALCKSHNASFGDPLNNAPTPTLYFHGTAEFIEFRMSDGGLFDLLSFELVSNGFAQRWVETSRSGETIPIGQPTTLTLLEFSGENFTDITWFRVGTPFYATQIDNVTVVPNLVPQVLSVSPPDGATHVPTNALLTVAFGEPMDASTISTDTFSLVDQATNSITGSVAYDTNTLTATFTPLAGLLKRSTYTATLTTNVQTEAGTNLALDLVWTFSTVGFPDLITNDTEIAAGNVDYEGRDMVVSGCTLTVDGAHSFGSLVLSNGAVLTHPIGSTSSVPRLDVTLDSLEVDGTSRIDVKGKGYLGARRGDNAAFLHGRTIGNAQGSLAQSGGSHGGNGGGPAVNPAYGDYSNPSEPGSGGGPSGAPNNYPGDSGGGMVRISTDSLLLDGQIIADGESAQFGFSGAGSGGGVLLQVGTLAGSGRISANGGNCPGAGGAGGGGRVAIHFGDASAFDLANATANGGTNTPGVGGPGTIFLRDTNAAIGNLLITGPGGNTTWVTPPGDNLAHVLLANSAFLIATQVSVASLTLSNSSVVTVPDSISNHVFDLTLEAAGLVSIDETSRLDVTGKGYVGARRGGSTSLFGVTLDYELGSPPRNGGSHAGLGGGGSASGPYGNFADPILPGSGGGSSGSPNNYPGDNGGGILRVTAQSIALDGSILADGATAQFNGSGAGGGGSIFIEAESISGSGWIAANGGNCPGGGGGGGGGRIAVYYGEIFGFDLSHVVAQGGTNTATPGMAGTIYLKSSTDNRTLSLNKQQWGHLPLIHSVEPWFFTGV